MKGEKKGTEAIKLINTCDGIAIIVSRDNPIIPFVISCWVNNAIAIYLVFFFF